MTVKTRFILLLVASTLGFSGAAQMNQFNRYFNEAVAMIDNGEYNSGAELFSKALSYKKEAANNYRIADVYIFRGYCRYKLNKTKAALTDVDEGLKLKPGYLKGMTMKSLILLGDKKYDACVEWCKLSLNEKPGNEELLANLAESYYRLKKFDDSRHTFFRILEQNPRNTYAMRYIGSVHLRQKQWDSAVVHFSHALEVNPLDFDAYYDRGIARSYQKDYDNARSDIEKAMQLDTTTRYIGYNNLGFFLKLEQKDYQGAIDYFNKAIELSPKFAYAYSNRGFAKLGLGDTKGAYQDIKKSIKLDGTNSYAFKNLGLTYLKDGKNKDACKYFRKAAELGYSDMYDEEVDTLLKENCGN